MYFASGAARAALLQILVKYKEDLEDVRARQMDKGPPLKLRLYKKLVDHVAEQASTYPTAAEAVQRLTEPGYALVSLPNAQKPPDSSTALWVLVAKFQLRSRPGCRLGDAPDSKGTPIKGQGFQEYLKLLGKDGARRGGSLEIAALATTSAQPAATYLCVPKRGRWCVRAFNGGAKGTPIAGLQAGSFGGV